MLAQSPRPPQPPCRIGVGIDISRYGHHAAFLREDLQPAAPDLAFVESAGGYADLLQRLSHIAQRYGPVHFVCGLDVTGQYADNPAALPP
jgi:hypothetical protein